MEEELKELLNKHGADVNLGIPAAHLAKFLMRTLANLNQLGQDIQEKHGTD